MTKYEFLNYLKNRLKRYGKNNAEDAVAYYDEILTEKTCRDHMSEEEAVKSLGDPERIVSDTVSDMVINKKIRNPSTGVLVLFGLLSSPVLIPLAVALACIYIVLMAVWVVLVAAFGASSLALLVGGVASLFISVGGVGSKLLMLGGGLVGAVIMFVLCWLVAKYGVQFFNLITVKFYKKIKNGKGKE
jgi:uncharacterized membrane protein